MPPPREYPMKEKAFIPVQGIGEEMRVSIICVV